MNEFRTHGDCSAVDDDEPLPTTPAPTEAMAVERTAAEAMADAVAEALAKYAVAYTHVTLADMRTAGRSWKVHETGNGNPFVHNVWLGEFDNKTDANALCAKLRREAAVAAAATRLTASAHDGSGENKAFELEWIGAARPPVHPEPMKGRRSFVTLDKAVAFWQRQPADATLVRLTEHTTYSADRTAALAHPTPQQGAREALQQIADQEEHEIALDPDWPRRIAKAALATPAADPVSAPAKDGAAATTPADPGAASVVAPRAPIGHVGRGSIPQSHRGEGENYVD